MVSNVRSETLYPGAASIQRPKITMFNAENSFNMLSPGNIHWNYRGGKMSKKMTESTQEVKYAVFNSFAVEHPLCHDFLQNTLKTKQYLI